MKMHRFSLIALFILGLTFTGCQSMEMVSDPRGPDHPGHEFTQHYKHSHFAVTKDGNYSVELVLKEGTLKTGLNEMDVIIHDKQDRDVTGAGVSIIPFMPVHRHGVDISPIVIERGGGTYSARNVDITMPGKWQLTVRVSTVRANDEATFDFMLDAGGDMMETMQMPHDMQMGKEMDKARVESARKKYIVTYKAPMPLPLNKLHSWDIMIADQRRIAVAGVKVTVGGGMPAHGHGLPTKPVVVETGMPGMYRLDGMKFTMPGEWVVRIHIDDKLETDTAEFLFRVQ